MKQFVFVKTWDSERSERWKQYFWHNNSENTTNVNNTFFLYQVWYQTDNI